MSREYTLAPEKAPETGSLFELRRRLKAASDGWEKCTEMRLEAMRDLEGLREVINRNAERCPVEILSVLGNQEAEPR